MQLIQYSKCSTCKKACKWLDDHDIKYNPHSSDENDYLESNGIITQEHIKKPEDATYDIPENNADSITNNDSSNTKDLRGK